MEKKKYVLVRMDGKKVISSEHYAEVKAWLMLYNYWYGENAYHIEVYKCIYEI